MVKQAIDGGPVRGNPGTDDMLRYIEDMDGARITIEVELEYTLIDGATPNASRWAGALNSLYPGVSHGIVSVRNIAGTNTVSQHAYGNAVDTFGSSSTLASIWHFGIANAAAYNIRLLIYQTSQFYGGSVSGYGGVPHSTHVHADFNPSYPL